MAEKESKQNEFEEEMNEQEMDFQNSEFSENPVEESEESGQPEEINPAEMYFSLKQEYEKEKAVSAEYLRRLQSLQADYDNYRKRTLREKEELAKYASEKIITELLPVLDNLERGMAASQQTKDFEGLVKGVDMIFRQLTALLEKEGLTPIEAAGEQFDPTKHEAVMRVEIEGYEPNTVVDEMQRGYFLKDKVLRPSMVRVSQ